MKQTHFAVDLLHICSLAFTFVDKWIALGKEKQSCLDVCCLWKVVSYHTSVFNSTPPDDAKPVYDCSTQYFLITFVTPMTSHPVLMQSVKVSPTEPYACKQKSGFAEWPSTCFFSISWLFSLCPCLSMSQIMQHHGCRSHMRDQNKLTGLEERFDLVVDSNDVILERVVWPLALVWISSAKKKKSLCKLTKLLYLIFRGFFLMKLMGWTGASSLSCLQGFSLPRLSFPAGIARLAN